MRGEGWHCQDKERENRRKEKTEEKICVGNPFVRCSISPLFSAL